MVRVNCLLNFRILLVVWGRFVIFFFWVVYQVTSRLSYIIAYFVKFCFWSIAQKTFFKIEINFANSIHTFVYINVLMSHENNCVKGALLLIFYTLISKYCFPDFSIILRRHEISAVAEYPSFVWTPKHNFLQMHKENYKILIGL